MSSAFNLMRVKTIALLTLVTCNTGIFLPLTADADPVNRAKPSSSRSRATKPTVTSHMSQKPILAIENFLNQVKTKNGAYQAADLNRSAALSYADEAVLQIKPNFFASAALNSDAKPSPFFRYDHIENNAYSVGVSQQFSFGLQAKFSYQFGDTNYAGIAARYFEARPQIEATLPLWRNLFGSETRSGIEAAQLSARARAESFATGAKSALLEAEATYWRLALSREALKVSQDALARAQAIYDWTDRRVRLSLADRAEGLQATAQLKARKLEIKQSEDDERSASLAFNAARGFTADKVGEDLATINSELVSSWSAPIRSRSRPDVEAARLQLAATEAAATAAKERTKPTLELFGQYAFNSPQRATQSEAVTDSFQPDKPSSVIGIRLQVPIDQEIAARSQDGWLKETVASRILADRKKLEEDRDWSDLVARFELAKEKVSLYEDLEIAQREKLEYERGRQKAGRATLAQVIQFETDFEQTQFARIRSLAELLTLNAQMKLYQ